MVGGGGFALHSKLMDEDMIARKECGFEKGQCWLYADVMKANTDKEGAMENINAKTVELVVTESLVSEGLWFHNSVVGVMRSFNNITRVKKRLWNRGFSFTAKFLGGKAILWSFESIQECEGFIRNSFFWKDLFLSMEKWSVVYSFDQKPVWFNFTGIALDYWNEVFFKKLGSKFGDLALVDKGTRLRKRLDSTRLLLLVSPAKVVEKVVGSGINPKGCKKAKSRGVIRKQSNDDRGQIGVQIEGFRQFGGAWFTRGVGVDSEGASNGLITLWKEDRFLVKACISSRSCIILVGELAKILFLILWVIGGDFNTVLFQSERVGVGLNLGDMESFRRFILQNQTGLFRSLSDHNPNLLSDLKMDKGPIPFRFYNNWLEEKALMKEALMGWVNCKENGSNGVVLRSKLKASKIGIKNWLVMHKEPEVNSKALESQLGLKDSQAVHHGCTDQSKFQKRSLIEELWKALHREEQLWRQKSRVDWLKESNRDTSFFHFMANGRRKSNFIGEIFHEGALCSDHVSIRKSVYRSFSNHFKVGNWVRPTMRGECSKGFQRKKRIRLRCPLV
ncbi:hypothetical protein Ddye_027735 [Dipteronia dyeriana]|uniref:DUF4283 domain-containing protein n=1 Tax=Dipteronia dyeriana TaxID=168575 RepID=A0AAD9TQM0_9ROSI|nr:hypothetical protein Ddye_027735 [Dipteronia dyeriana]